MTMSYDEEKEQEQQRERELEAERVERQRILGQQPSNESSSEDTPETTPPTEGETDVSAPEPDVPPSPGLPLEGQVAQNPPPEGTTADDT